MTENFKRLFEKNVNDRVSTKKSGGTTLSYLSWAYAWAETKKEFPLAQYEIHHFDGKPYLLDEDLGYLVMTTVTIDELSHTMWLPVMNHSNKAMKNVPYEYTTKRGSQTVEQATMFDINTTIMRCLVKNLAMHGLGLYIYAGEDLPVNEIDDAKEEQEQAKLNAQENSKYQQLVVKLFEQMVAEHGGNDKVYKLLGTDRTKYIESYTKNPKQLLETMQEYA